MRFHYGAIPEDPGFHPETEGWQSIHEPGPIALQFIAIPVLFVLSVLWGLFMILLVMPGMQSPIAGTSTEIRYWWWLVLFILMVPMHEFLHILAHPYWGSSSNSIIGLWLTKGMFFAHYEG
jgi:hypothetical protein